MTRIPAWSLLLLSLSLAGCGNKGPLVQAPPKPVEDGAPVTEQKSQSDAPLAPARTDNPGSEQEARPLPAQTPVEPQQTPPASDSGG
jgi:predicted small lipoprotein YifL